MTNNIFYNNNFAKNIFNNYGPQDLQNDLLKMGIFTQADSAGRIYPLTFTATTILDMLLMQLQKNNVKIYVDTKVEDVKVINEQIYIYTNKESFIVSDVIFATGGLAYSMLGSNTDGYSLLSNLGVKITKLKPGLVGLKTSIDDVKGLEGIRQKANVSLLKKGKVVFSEVGEIQFKKDGISGIVVMNASSIMARQNDDLQLRVDFLSSFKSDEIIEKLTYIKKLNPSISFEDLSHGILPKALATKLCHKLKDNLTIASFVRLAKNYEIKVISDYGFANAQVTVGGVMIDEVDEHFALKKNNHIYVIGELLDVDGLCGGYNMHFAMASGVNVAMFLARKLGEESYE